MQRRVALVAAALFCACDPSIPKQEPTAVIIAQFDPSASPPVVPTPNDLAADPKTGLLKITPPPGSTPADLAFYDYLNGLNGFPPSATATAAFDGPLDKDSAITADAVHVYDVTDSFAKVDAGVIYDNVAVTTEDGGTQNTGRLSIVGPAGGWRAGHSYAIGLVSGAGALKGDSSTGGAKVVGSSTWSFLRLEHSLVTCADLSSPDCKTSTEVIPSDVKDDPAKRLQDQTKTALQLERLRLKYKPVVDQLVKDNVARENIVLAWTFKIADTTSLVFDPSVKRIPLPNDLVMDRATGLVNIPIDSSYSAAYQEFIRDYLNTLDGFPVSSAGQVGVAGGDLDPASVTNATVLVFPIDGKPPVGIPSVRYNGTTKTIDIAPPNGSWGKGRKMAIAVLGRQSADVGSASAPDAVTQVGGGAVVASSIWALVRSGAPLVDCPNGDPTMPGCTLAITAAPLKLGDATQLELLRLSYAPILDQLEAQGHSRADVAILWTFKTVSFAEATFDPSTSVIPFPNDVLRTAGPPPHLTLPVPDGGSPLLQQVLRGLNTLDGFSLTAPIISESSDTKGALDFGEIDPAALDGGTTGFFRLDPGTQPSVDVCVNCASSPQADGGAPLGPQQLQFVPRLPLTEQGKYGAYLTGALRDRDGHRIIASPTFALTRLANPLCDTMKSTVPVLSDVQACGAGGQPGLEQLRLGLKPLVDGLMTGPTQLARKDLVLAWAFTAQTTVTELQNLANAVPSVPSLSTTVNMVAIPTAMAIPAALITPNHLGPVLFMGTMTLPFALTNTGATMNTPANWLPQKAAYMLTVPATAAPPNGYPVVIFGHGLTSKRTAMVAIANALGAAGFATLAVDVVWHGERTTCKGATAVLGAIPNATDDYACALPGGTMPDPINAACDQNVGRCAARNATSGADCTAGGDGLCLAMGQGYCLANGHCENAVVLPSLNAWNFLNLGNLFAARDNFRHYAIDLTQVVRVIKADAFFNANVPMCMACAPHLDGATINYVGQSLGGFNGTLFAAVSPDVKYVMLNVPGSDQIDALLVSPGFKTVRDGFLAQIAPLGLVPGTPQFDQLITLTKTIFDKSDPQNFGYLAVNRNLPVGRKVFIQSIQNDFVVPNFTTDKLIAAASSGAGMPALERVNPTLIADPPAGMPCMPPAGSLCASSRHGFLLNFVDVGTTAAAQTKAATFMATGVP